MKKSDVELGRDYFVKVSGQIKTVRLIGPHPLGGYEGRVLQTDRYIRIKTAARLRGIRNDSPGAKCMVRRTDLPNDSGVDRYYAGGYGYETFWSVRAAILPASDAHKVATRLASMRGIPAVVEVF